MEKENTESVLMTVEQVAAYLGIKHRTIYDKVQRETIPFTRVGGLLRFRKADIDAWLDENTVRPQPTR